MKTINLKTLALGGMAIMLAAAGLPPMGTGKVGGVTTLPARYRTRNSEVSADLMNIVALNNNVGLEKNKIKADCKAGLKADEIRDRRLLGKTEADLSKEKAYLVADKKAYLDEYRMVVSRYRAAWNDDRRKLYTAKKNLREDMARGNDLQKDAATVAWAQRLVNTDIGLVRLWKMNMDNDELAMNRDIRKANAEPMPVTATQDAYASVDDWLQK